MPETILNTDSITTVSPELDTSRRTDITSPLSTEAPSDATRNNTEEVYSFKLKSTDPACIDKDQLRMSLKEKQGCGAYYEVMTPEIYQGSPPKEIPLIGVWDGLVEKTTSHGIPQFVNASGSIKKGIWFIITLATLSGLTYILEEIVTKYLRNEVIVTLTVYQANQQKFPAVTLCNTNPFQRSKAASHQELAAILGVTSESTSARSRKKRFVQAPSCVSNNYYPQSGYCYALSTDKVQGDELTDSLCGESGWSLAVVDNTNTHTFLKTNAYIFDGISPGMYYIQQTNSWSAWRSGEPDYKSNGKDNCISVNILDDHKWHTENCNIKCYVLCQYLPEGNEIPTTTVASATEGVTTTQPTTPQPTTPQPTTVPLTTPQPTTAQPTTAQPTKAQPTTAQPTEAQPTTAQPTTAQPTTVPLTTPQPTTAQPTTAQPTKAQPTTAQPTKAQPTTTQPTTMQLATTAHLEGETIKGGQITSVLPSSTTTTHAAQSTQVTRTNTELTSSSTISRFSSETEKMTSQTTDSPPKTTEDRTVEPSEQPQEVTPYDPPPTPTPLRLTGSVFPERIQTTEEFSAEEETYEKLADISEEDKRSVGFEPHELVLDCEFAGHSCNISHFSYVYNAVHGNCYTFNSEWNPGHPVYWSSQVGPRYGLKVILNIHQHEYLQRFGETAGMRLVVHPQNKMPFPEDEGLLARTGQLTSVGLRKVSIQKLGRPYTNCEHLETANLTKNVYEQLYPVQYTPMACFKTCYQKNVIAECGCSDPGYPSYGAAFDYIDVKSCKSTDIVQDDCKYNISKLYAANELDCDCEDPCTEDVFFPEVSVSSWPADNYVPSIMNQYREQLAGVFAHTNDTDFQALTDNLAKLEVYFKEFKYEKIEEIPSYKDTSFFTDIGGSLGLWIGWSLITVFEFIELLTDLVILICVKLKAGKLKRSVHPAVPSTLSRREATHPLF